MIVRFDDFPSGVRPILPDLSTFFKMFDEFEKNKITFYLGIVPDLLSKVRQSDLLKLKSYQYLIPCQHGYDHAYYKYSKILIDAKDEFNTKTLGTFNEFNQVPISQIKSRLKVGKKILENFFKRIITHYIPVCNYIDNDLVESLKYAGFETIFTTPQSIEVEGLQTIETDISCRLYQLKKTDNYKSICLHCTWEFDAIQKNGFDNWLKDFNSFFKVAKTGQRIPKIANFYWNLETPMSYLRYLTLLSFRKLHPDWQMILWTSASNVKNVWKGVTEKQDFQNKIINGNYLSQIDELGVQIKPFKSELCKTLAPNYLSDIIRFKSISGGGWFFDMDQIFTRNFDELCDYDFVTGGHTTMYCGVLGASENSKIPEFVTKKQLEKLNKSTQLNGYCELGNQFLHLLSLTSEFKTISANESFLDSGIEYFYPIFDSGKVDQLYSGKVVISELINNYAVHWYGGHPKSQGFNSAYNEQFAQTSNDSISVYCRGNGIIT